MLTPVTDAQQTTFFRRTLDDARIRISRISSKHQDLTEVFKGICEISADTLQVERVGIWLLVNQKTALRCVCLFERSKRQFSEGTTLQVADFPNYFAGLKDRKTLRAERAAIDPKTNELKETYLEPLGIVSMLDAPILIDGEMYGVVCHEHIGDPREWSSEERDFVGSMADLTALKMKSAESEKLRRLVRDCESDRAAMRQRECLGSMAAGTAHDFRNFLLIISHYASEIASEPNLKSDLKESAHEIMRTVERGKTLADELMEIGREHVGQPRVLNLADHLRDFLPTLQSAAGEQHQLDLKAGPGSGSALIDRSEWERVMMNLVINARDAMKIGGPITISIAQQQPNDDGQITIAVADTGEGIDPAISERIFDPFFTTKPRGTGTGLGLSVVRRAVEHAGGGLRVESQRGQGTTFFIKLPRVTAG